ncbi:MAG: SDR family oxidoreductase [Victivallales bacterium]|nr:SDR family oxidoreductase [Victivallales bacterium]
MNWEADFAGRTAVVTGGTSGIGATTARALASAGCEVFFCGRHGDKEGVATACGGRAHYTQCDVADEEALHAWLDGVVRSRGAIDYLVNNVAFDGRMDFEQTTAADFDRFVALNLRSAFLVTRHCLEGLRAGKGRAIVTMGTTNWMLGLSPFTLYSSAKSGLVGFTRALARELGPENIRANMVSPGWVMTKKQLELYVTEQDKQDLLRDQSLPFLLEEKHITPPILFLLSSAAAAITGQNLVVDAGKFMQ